MAEPFKLRHVNSVVGVFVLGALALALLGIAAAGRSRRWFEGSVEVGARFPAEALESLAAGAPVTLGAERVGEVLALAPDGGGARARLQIHRSAREQLRADARAVLHVPLGGLLGQPTVELRRGFAERSLPEGAELPGGGGSELTGDVDRLVRHVDELVVRLGPVLERVDVLLSQLEKGGAGSEASALLHEAAGIARGARERQLVAEAAGAVGELRAVVASLRAGEGSVGKLLTDPTLHDRLTGAVERADTALESVARLGAAASGVASDLGAVTARARSRADDLELLLARAETLVLRANQTLESLQRHWLLGGATSPDGAPPAPPAVLDRGPEGP